MKQLYSSRVIIRQSLPILLAILGFSIVTGNFLEGSAKLIVEDYPFLLLTIPAFINMAGSLSNVLTSRITSSLYIGQIDEDFRPYRILFSNIIGILIVAITGFIFLAFMIITINSISFNIEINALGFFFIIIFSGVFTTILMSVVGLLAARITYHHGLNPDNFTTPLTTTIGDTVGILLLVLLAVHFM